MENHKLLERLTGLVNTIIARGTAPQQQQVGQVETTEEALRTWLSARKKFKLAGKRQ